MRQAVHAPDFWYRPRPNWQARLLTPAAALYSTGGAVRLALGRAQRLPIPVVCVGNFVAGGTGKTPIALSLATLAIKAGARPHLLAHGYKARFAGPVRVDPERHTAGDVGDESLLLARVAPTWVARDRPASARAAMQAGANLLIMDDGLQDPALIKDFNLVAVDGETGMGNGLVIPAGPLREPIARGLARANAVVIMGKDTLGCSGILGNQHSLLHAKLELTPNAKTLAGRRVLAFAGIGRPEKFFRTLREIDCELTDAVAFPDHHSYTPDEIKRLHQHALRANAVPVTTEKDHVRLPTETRAIVTPIPVTLAWENEEAVFNLLQPLLNANSHTARDPV